MITLEQVEEYNVYVENGEERKFYGRIDCISPNYPTRTVYYFHPTTGVNLDENACYEISCALKDKNNNQSKSVTLKIPHNCSECVAESCTGSKEKGTDSCHAKLFRHYFNGANK
jgi:hypothetical protein